MRRLRYLPLPPLLVSLLVPASVFAAPWNEDKAFFTENAGSGSSKVDAADLNGDGNIDLVFANNDGFDKGDDLSVLPQQAFLNDGTKMTDASANIFGGTPYAGRAVKIRDIDYDGDNDIVLGTTWQNQSQLFLNTDGQGNFENATAMNLPLGLASVGDLELGDVDGDGDLDIALSNWGNPGPGLSVAQSDGGITLLWTQMGKPAEFGGEGTAMFEDVTAKQMPGTKVRWSWELEFVDVDNDYDLDILVSASAGDLASLFLFTNDGAGKFVDATAGNVPQGKFSQDVEPMDLNGDAAIDLLTLHDGVSGRNRLLINDKSGKFTDSTDVLWPKLDNPPSFDFMGAFYDYDSNSKVDFILGAIQTAQDKYPDRLVFEMGGKFKVNKAAFTEMPVSNGSYAIVLADFNLDRRLDMAMAQKENATQKKVFLASEEIPVDTVAPFLTNIEAFGELEFPGTAVLRLRSHDNKSPLMLHDFLQTNENEGFPFIESWISEPKLPDDEPGTFSEPGQWYGEYLWRINFQVPDADKVWYRICAIDAANNKRCTELLTTTVTGGTATESDSESVTESNSETNTESNSNTNTESNSNTLSDSDSFTESNSNSNSNSNSESNTEPTESNSNSNSNSNSESATEPTESNSNSNSQTISESNSESVTDSNSGIDSADFLDDDGCGCDADSSPTGGVLSSLALLGLLGLRRRRN